MLSLNSVRATDRSPVHGGTALHAATSIDVVRILVAANAGQPPAKSTYRVRRLTPPLLLLQMSTRA
jgi:hypothetical protein